MFSVALLKWKITEVVFYLSCANNSKILSRKVQLNSVFWRESFIRPAQFRWGVMVVNYSCHESRFSLYSVSLNLRHTGYTSTKVCCFSKNHYSDVQSRLFFIKKLKAHHSFCDAAKLWWYSPNLPYEAAYFACGFSFLAYWFVTFGSHLLYFLTLNTLLAFA